MSKWISIDSAPKDGSVFLIATTADAGRVTERQEVFEARWDDYQKLFTARNGFLVFDMPTMWQPLPEPPELSR